MLVSSILLPKSHPLSICNFCVFVPTAQFQLACVGSRERYLKVLSLESQGGGGKSVVLRMTVDLSVLLAAGVLTFLMGAIGGFIPSISAMRLRPLESLR